MNTETDKVVELAQRKGVHSADLLLVTKREDAVFMIPASLRIQTLLEKWGWEPRRFVGVCLPESPTDLLRLFGEDCVVAMVPIEEVSTALADSAEDDCAVLTVQALSLPTQWYVVN